MSFNKTQYVATAYIKNKRGRVLSIGKNSYIKTHPKMVKLGRRLGYLHHEKRFIHAEIDALNKCVNLEKAYSIEVYIYSKGSNRYTTSMPCPICTMALKESGIRFVDFQDQYGNRVIKPITELHATE